MKAINIIEEAIKELNTLVGSKEKRLAIEHLKKAIVQIGIGKRGKKILEDRRKVAKGEDV